MKKETFGQRMRRLRMRMNISQDQLAEALKTTRQTVSAWENDKNTIDNYKLIDLQKVLRVTWDELMEGDDHINSSYKSVFSNESDGDYRGRNEANGLRATWTDLANLSVAGNYLVAKQDLELLYPLIFHPSYIIAIAKEARLSGFKVFDVGFDYMTLCFDTDDGAKRFKQFLDDIFAQRYEHQPRFDLVEMKFNKKYFDIRDQFEHEGVREVFDIKTEKIYVVVANDGVKGYAESVEDAQKLAKELSIKQYQVMERDKA